MIFFLMLLDMHKSLAIYAFMLQNLIVLQSTCNHVIMSFLRKKTYHDGHEPKVLNTFTEQIAYKTERFS